MFSSTKMSKDGGYLVNVSSCISNGTNNNKLASEHFRVDISINFGFDNALLQGVVFGVVADVLMRYAMRMT